MRLHKKTRPNAKSVSESQMMLSIKVQFHHSFVNKWSHRAFIYSYFCFVLMWEWSSFSCFQMRGLETRASSFSSCAWLLWWLAWVGLLFIVSLERRTLMCVSTSRKTWNFSLDLYDEEWTLSHSGSLLVHHSSYFILTTLSLYYHFWW